MIKTKFLFGLCASFIGIGVSSPTFANTVKFTFNGPSLNPGRITIGAGGNLSTFDFIPGLTPEQLAIITCEFADNPAGCQAMGNMVIYDGPLGGGYVYDAGSMSPITITRMVMPPPPPPIKPPKAINIFGEDGGTVVIGKDGTITKTFNGPGINIISSIDFSASDTVQTVNTNLFNDLNSQAGSLPDGFSFGLEQNGVSLIGTEFFDISVTDEISFSTGEAMDMDIGTFFTANVPEPTSTLSLLSLGILGAGATLKRKVKRTHSIKKEPTNVG